MFFIGSLEAASQEAFYGKARDVSKLIDSLVPRGEFFLIFFFTHYETIISYKILLFLLLLYIFFLFWLCEIRSTDVTNVDSFFSADVIPAGCRPALLF